MADARRRQDPPQPPESSELHVIFWRSLPPALAVELGALTVIAAGAYAGIVVGLVSAVVLPIALLALRTPGPTSVRIGILLAGPPLRYALVVAAVAVEWLARNDPVLALVSAAVLVLLVPLVGVIMEAPGRRLRPH